MTLMKSLVCLKWECGVLGKSSHRGASQLSLIVEEAAKELEQKLSYQQLQTGQDYRIMWLTGTNPTSSTMFDVNQGCLNFFKEVQMTKSQQLLLTYLLTVK